MAGEARVVSNELRGGDLLLREQVEDDPLLRILGGQLDEAAAHPADGHGIVEEQGPRIARGDEAGLHAGLREDGDLRVDGDLQRLERRRQVAAHRIERELNAAGRQLSIQLGDRIVCRARVVLDRRMIDRVKKRDLQLRRCQRTGGQERDQKNGRLHDAIYSKTRPSRMSQLP